MAGVQGVAKQSGMTILPRSRAEVARFLDGLELVDPGIVPVLTWKPDRPYGDPHAAYYWAGVARKP